MVVANLLALPLTLQELLTVREAGAGPTPSFPARAVFGETAAGYWSALPWENTAGLALPMPTIPMPSTEPSRSDVKLSPILPLPGKDRSRACATGYWAV